MTRGVCYVSHPIAFKTEEQKSLLEAVASTFVRDVMRMEPLLPRTIQPYCTLNGQVRQDVIDATGCTIPGRTIPGDVHTVQCYMRGDLLALIQCERILMMPGYQHSAGCRDELNMAMICGIPISFYEESDIVVQVATD